MKITDISAAVFLFFLFAGCTTSEKALFSFDASRVRTGVYNVEDLNRDWGKPLWENGVSQGLVSVADDDDPDHPRALRVRYPKGSYSASTIPGRSQWIVKFKQSYDELYCSYYVKFDRTFDFVRTGKLPGLVGGKHNSGGNKPNGLDGWSARVVWLPGGEIGEYLYHPDQPSKYGQVFKYVSNGENVVIKRGKWHRIVNRIVMNTPRKRDGIMQAWIDGNLVLDVRNLRFRDTSTIGIDALYFSTFFGGDGQEWAAVNDEYASFDDFLVSTAPISP